jgi:phage protein D
MLNDPNAPSVVRHPRSIVKIGGAVYACFANPADNINAPMPMPGWIEWEVENNSFFAADRFSVSFAVSALPDGRKEDWFVQQEEITVEIFAGFPADPDNYDTGQLQSLIYGQADEVEFDPVRRVIHLSGRDLTGRMIDTKVTDVFVNRTTADVARMMAAKYDLLPRITDSKIDFGKYYANNINAQLRSGSDWDVLCQAAHLAQFNVYVSGHELHFEPPTDSNQPTYMLQWQSDPFTFNGTHLHFTRSLILAAGARVTVRSANQKTGKVAQGIYPQSAPSSAQQYTYKFANLNPEQAQARAESLYKEIAQHEIKLRAELPADLDISTQTVLQVSGTGTIFDQKYYPDAVTRRMSFHDGFTMSVTAKNMTDSNVYKLNAADMAVLKSAGA